LSDGQLLLVQRLISLGIAGNRVLDYLVAKRVVLIFEVLWR